MWLLFHWRPPPLTIFRSSGPFPPSLGIYIFWGSDLYMYQLCSLFACLQDSFYDKTPYTIMFGPDKCGADSKVSRRLHLCACVRACVCACAMMTCWPGLSSCLTRKLPYGLASHLELFTIFTYAYMYVAQLLVSSRNDRTLSMARDRGLVAVHRNWRWGKMKHPSNTFTFTALVTFTF